MHETQATLDPDNNSPPKLTLRLLFVWITLSALAIAVSNFQYLQMVEHVEAQQRPMFDIARLLSAFVGAIAAAQLTTMGVLVHVWQKTGRMLTQPGHWLLWVASLTTVLGCGVMIMHHVELRIAAMEMDWTRYGWLTRRFLFRGILTLLTIIIPIGLNVFAGFRHKGLWRVCFFLAVIPILGDLIGMHTFSMFPQNAAWRTLYWIADSLMRAIPAVFVVYAALSEKIDGVSRDWLHWIGVGTAAATALIMGTYAVLNLVQ